MAAWRREFAPISVFEGPHFCVKHERPDSNDISGVLRCMVMWLGGNHGGQ